MRVLFQHGQDPQVGDKPLGPIDVLAEDKRGAYYEVPLLDAPYVREILPGLRAGLYGASFRFSVQREEFDRDAEPSDHNPQGLPERTLKEVAVREFGPVTFPAYAGASAGVRSLTDDFILGRYRLSELAPLLFDDTTSAPPTDAAQTGTSARDAAQPKPMWPTAPQDLWEEELWTP
jgi:phage head maturation protease